MKRIIPISLGLLLCLVSALPAFSQGNENNDWQAIVDQRDQRRQAELIEKFISSYSNSPHRPNADKMLVSFWTLNGDNARILNHVDNFKQSLPSADAASKSTIYAQGMMAAISLGNQKKVVEFGNFALTADDKNFSVLSILAFSKLVDGKTTLDYATRAVALPKPVTMPEATYQMWVGRMSTILGQSLVGQNKFKEALPHLETALKANPKDHETQYASALTHYYLMREAVKAVTEAKDDADRAMLKEPTVQADVDKARAKMEAESKIALERRDAALDAFAKALAIGGAFAPQSKSMVDSLYSSKTPSMEGLDLFIAAKKKEVGL